MGLILHSKSYDPVTSCSDTETSKQSQSICACSTGKLVAVSAAHVYT